MNIQKLIRNRIFESEFTLYDTKGNKQDIAKFRSDFTKLRNYLSQNYRDGGVGIKLPKEPSYLMVMLACMDAGVPYVPMRANYPEDRVNQIKDEAGFTLLMTQEKLDEVLNTDEVGFSEIEHGPMDTLYTICTSGSTGKPKAVVVSRTSITDFWKWCDENFDEINDQDKVLQVADFTFDISLIDVGLFLHKNAEVHFSNFTGMIFTLMLEIVEKKISFLNTVVNNFNMLLDDNVVGRGDISSLKSVVMGGARFSLGLYKKCKNHFNSINVYNLYGVTEVPVYSHAKRMNFDGTDMTDSNVSVGKTLGSTTGVIVKDGKRVEQGSLGELFLGGGQLMKGYANNPEMTAQAIVEFEGEKYYRTGDISYQDNRGEFFIIGRMDDTIKYRGYRINLLDIDSYILRLEYVEDCATVAIPNEITQNTTYGYIKLKEEKTVKEIKADLGELLLEYQIPEVIKLIDSFPTNDNGKICKKTLRAMSEEEA